MLSKNLKYRCVFFLSLEIIYMKTLVDKHLAMGLMYQFQVLSIKIIRILKFCLQMYILLLFQFRFNIICQQIRRQCYLKDSLLLTVPKRRQNTTASQGPHKEAQVSQRARGICGEEPLLWFPCKGINEAGKNRLRIDYFWIISTGSGA